MYFGLNLRQMLMNKIRGYGSDPNRFKHHFEFLAGAKIKIDDRPSGVVHRKQIFNRAFHQGASQGEIIKMLTLKKLLHDRQYFKIIGDKRCLQSGNDRILNICVNNRSYKESIYLFTYKSSELRTGKNTIDVVFIFQNPCKWY